MGGDVAKGEGQHRLCFQTVSSGLTGGQFRGATGPRRATNGRGQWCYLDIFSTLT